MATELDWIVKEFHEFDVETLYAVMRLRIEVFSIEQNCIYQDLDNKDQSCLHLLGVDQDRVAAYCRIIPPGAKYKEPAISRVITAMDYRGRQLGKDLVRRAIALTNQTYPGQGIRISAQERLRRFYEDLGFLAESEIYLEDDIDHIEMALYNVCI